jgi:predicted acetyltransferase
MELQLVADVEKEKLTTLVNDYLKTHCDHQEIRVGPETVDDYVYYREYWREQGRYPYFIKSDGAVVGFVLVRTVFEDQRHFYQVSDFYIKPEFESRGYGTDAIEKLWSMYPGSWELQVLAKNKRADIFWARCISLFALSDSQRTEQEYEDGRRYQYNFVVPTPP